MRLSDWSSDVCSAVLFPARHAGHHDVGEEELDRRVLPLQQPERRGAVMRLQYPIADLAQQLDRIATHVVVILDDQQAFLGSAMFQRRLRAFLLIQRSVTHQARSEEHTSELQSLMRISY